MRLLARCLPGLAKTKSPLSKAKAISRWAAHILSWSFWSVATLLFLALVLVALLLYPSVQTWLAQRLSARLTAELGITVHIDRVELRPFGPEHLRGVYLADLHGDTLITADDLRIAGLRFRPRARLIEARTLELHGGRFALRTDSGEVKSNLTRVLDRLSGTDTTAAGEPWSLRCGRFTIDGMHFSYANGNTRPAPFGVDLDHVDVTGATVTGSDLVVAGDSILADLERVALREKSGLQLDRLSGRATVSPRGIRIDGMRLRTPGTDLDGELAFITSSWSDFAAFTERVQLRLDLRPSRLQFADIALFAPDLQGIDLPIRVKGLFRGTVNELKGRHVEIGFGRRSFFRGSADLSGLPDIDNTFMVVDVEEVRTDAQELEAIPVPPFMQGARLAMPEEVHRLGDIAFAGNFTGFLNAFTAYGKARTAAGAFRTDLSFERDTVSGLANFNGRVATDGLDIARITGEGTLGTMACDLRVKAVGRTLRTMRADLEGEVPLFTFNGSPLTNITINGRLEPNRFNGSLQARDPKLFLDFQGLADLSGRWPEVDFSAQVQHADLRSLGLIGGEGYNSVNMLVKARGQLAPDSLKGELQLHDISYCDGEADIALGDLLLRSDRWEGLPMIELRSSVADATITGPFLPTLLPGALRSVLFSVFPALQDEVSYAQEDQHFAFELHVKEAQPILDLLVPGLEVEPGMRASGSFDSRTFGLDLEAMIPFVRYGAFSGDSVHVILDKTLDVLLFSFHSARQTLSDSTFLSGIALSGKAYQDEFELLAGWSGASNGTEGELNLAGQVLGLRSASIDMLPSRLYFGRGMWHNERAAHIRLDSTTIAIDSLALENEGQHVLLDGTISKDPARDLRFSLVDLRLENVMPFYEGPELHGVIRGDGRAFDLYGSPFISSDLRLDSFAVADRRVGDIHVSAAWNERSRYIDLSGTLQRDTLKALDFVGMFTPGAEQDELDLTLLFDRFDVAFIEPYLPEGMSQLSGTLTGDIKVTGRLEEPLLNGSLLLHEAGVRVDYTNTRYAFTHRIDIRPNYFALDLVKVHDEEGNVGTAVGTIVHRAFRDWNFDVSVDMERMLVLNTTISQNELYYGKAYGTGRLQVSGYADNLELTVDARTEAGTNIHFPLGGSMEVGNISYVRFLNNGLAGDTLKQEVDLSGIRLDMDVEVTPDAQFELIFDPTVGDVLSGRGHGNLEMTVTPTGDFSMRGDVEVVGGDYLFTLRNLVNKRFGVDPGGHITWYGDPFDAQLNVNAVYKLRTALYDVMLEKSDAYKKRVPVEVVMQLKDKLLNPDIRFQVRLPSVDEGVRTQVNSVLSDPDEMNKQVFSLIVMNKFTPPSTLSTPQSGSGGNFAQTTGSEMLSNQVSNWLNRLSKDFDLGVNYRPGNQITQDELEVAVSTQLFNERLQVSTNLGYQSPSATAQSQNQFIGDFAVEYLLTDAGKLRVKAFSQSNDKNLNQADQAPTTQGVGLRYQEEFDSFGEFWRKFTAVFRKEERPDPAPVDASPGAEAP